MGIRKPIRQKSNDSELFLQTIIDVIEGNVFVKDTDGVYQFVNAAYCQNFNVKKNEVIGKDDYFVFSSEVAETLRENDKRIMQSLISETLEESGQVNGEVLTYRTNKVPLIDKSGKVYGICGVGFDITQEKKLEDERERLIIELQKALSEIKTLRGILPLCSYCKKVRDDEGYWGQVDVYIHNHTEANISHSICPECMEKYCPK